MKISAMNCARQCAFCLRCALALLVMFWVMLAMTPALLGQQTSSTVATTLAGLEARIAAAEAAGGVGHDLGRIELEAHTIVSQATATSDRIQARRILRRARHLADSLAAAPGSFVTQAGHAEYSYAAAPAMPPTSYSATPGEAPRDQVQAGLQRFAQIAANLAQYGAPPIEPECQPVPMTEMMPMPMAVAVAPPPTRHYLNLDALGWWVKGDRLPPLVTSSPIGTPQDQAGVLGLPSTTVLFGDQYVNTGIRWGGRAQGGVWLDDFQTFAIEGHYYGLTSADTSFSMDSDFSADPGATIMARPFFDANPLVDAQRARLTAYPDFAVPGAMPPLVIDLNGSIGIEERSFIQSAGGGVRYAVGPYNGPARLFLLGGYRFFELDEALAITTSSTASFDPYPSDAGYLISQDSFSTTNIFNGGELGLGAEFNRNRWTLGIESRLALGNMNQQLMILGETAAIYDVYAASYLGGLLAQPTNIGTFTQNKFAMIPQLDVKLGLRVLPRLRLTVGYNFTYVTNVLRPGGQVDLNVNSTQFAGGALTGPAVPTVLMDTTSIWLQGITMGLDFRF